MQRYPDYSDEEFVEFCRQQEAEQAEVVAKVAETILSAMRCADDFEHEDFLVAMRLVTLDAVNTLQGSFLIDDEDDPHYAFLMTFALCAKVLELSDVAAMKQELGVADDVLDSFQIDESNPEHYAVGVVRALLSAVEEAVGELEEAGVKALRTTVH